MAVQSRIAKAARNPHRVVEDWEFWTPEFCREFFDWCDQEAYDRPDAAIRRADLALELARKTRDPHMESRAHGVLASAYRIRCLYEASQAEFAHAFRLGGSCPCCLSDTFRRQGILRMYQLEFHPSIELYDKAISHYKAIDDEDGVGRTLVSRGIALWKLDRIDEALEDEREALRLFSSETPTVYHSAALANIVAFLATAKDERHFALAERCCHEVRILLAGRDGFTAVRIRLRWAHGLILARLGERKRGLQMLRKVRKAILRSRQDAEVVAITADISQLYCETEKYHLIVDIVNETLARLGDVLGTQPLLEKIVYAAQRELAETRLYVGRLREAIVTSMPCLLAADDSVEVAVAP